MREIHVLLTGLLVATAAGGPVGVSGPRNETLSRLSPEGAWAEAPDDALRDKGTADPIGRRPAVVWTRPTGSEG